MPDVGQREARPRAHIGDRETVIADPTAAGLAIKEPGAIRHTEPRSQGRDPSIVGSHLDSPGTRNEYGSAVVVVRSPIDVPFNSENSVTDLPVVPDLASSDEYAVVVSGAEVRADESVGHVTICPGRANVAAKIKSGPTERRRRIYRGRRRIRSRPRVHVSGGSVV